MKKITLLSIALGILTAGAIEARVGHKNLNIYQRDRGIVKFSNEEETDTGDLTQTTGETTTKPQTEAPGTPASEKLKSQYQYSQSKANKTYENPEMRREEVDPTSNANSQYFDSSSSNQQYFGDPYSEGGQPGATENAGETVIPIAPSGGSSGGSGESFGLPGLP